MTVRITPLHQGEMVALADQQDVYERQILPYGKFNYKGKEFDITPEWADNAIQAFKDRAIAQTYFALADERNSHDVDNRPDRFGGDIVDLVKTDTGLKGRYKLTPKAQEIIKDNPKLGVSARFYTDYEREADGKKWPVVIDQVLGTLNPKIINTDEWKKVSLSEVDEGQTVEDSSGEEWKVPEENKNGPTVTVDKATLDSLMEFVKAKKAEEDEINNLLGNGNKKEEPEKVGLSNEDKSQITSLSNEVRLARQEVSGARFERDALAWKQAGVPPHLVELARPVLESYDAVDVVTLSEDGSTTTTDARMSLRKILDELKGTVVLSNEQGHGATHKEGDKDAAKEEDDLLSLWDKGMV